MINYIAGASGNDWLAGAKTNDNIDGRDSNDTVFGNEGDDTVHGDNGNDFINGNVGNDFVYGDRGNDTVRGGRDRDYVNGNMGSDFVYGDRGNDTVYGGKGNDTVHGGKDNDLINGNIGNDAVYGDLGNDTVHGGKDSDFINGNAGNDFVYGDKGSDNIHGGKGDDTLKGGIGLDTLSGDLGSDLLIGGGHTDYFGFSSLLHSTRTSIDTIADFVQGEDKIYLPGLGFDDIAAGLGAGSTLGFSNNGSTTTIVDADSDFTIKLDGAFNLIKSDFVFSSVSSAPSPPSSPTISSPTPPSPPSPPSPPPPPPPPPSSPPVNTVPSTQTTGANANFVVLGISVSDADSSTMSSITFSVDQGTLNIPGIAGSTVTNNNTSSVTISNANVALMNAKFASDGITYTPTTDFFGNSVITIASNDGSNSVTNTFIVNVLPSPSGTIPWTQKTGVDAPVVISSINLSDLNDTTLQTVTFTTTTGTITLKNNVASGITAGQITGNGTNTVTVTGALVTALNTTFADANGVTFTPPAGTSGKSTVTLTLNDGTYTSDGTFDVITYSTISTSSLDGTTGFKLTGGSSDDRIGGAVSSAGDVNNDGFDDIIIGAGKAPGGGSYGESYVVFGKASGFAANIDISTLDGTTGFQLSGDTTNFAYRAEAGNSVSYAGDINGDGYGDVIIGAYKAHANTTPSSAEQFVGRTFVMFGKAGVWAADTDLWSVDGTNGFELVGIAQDDHSGISVSSAGDINGDGFDDIIIGAPDAADNGSLNTGKGETYVMFGKAAGYAASTNLSAIADGTAGFRITGISFSDKSGNSVSSAGDVNGDGYGDIIIGASNAAVGASSSVGESFVIFGKKSGWVANLTLSSLDGTNGFKLTGIDASDFSGGSVKSAGDINNDGYDDIIIGASNAAPSGGATRGESYIVFGKSGGFPSNINLSTLNGTDGFRLTGIADADWSGKSVSSAGDINGDGYDDIIIGADGVDKGGNNWVGESYILFGKSGAWAANTTLSVLDGTNGFALPGVADSDGAGSSVSSAGDVNGDGFADVIIGAPFGGGVFGASPYWRGESYVVFGRDDNSVVTHMGTTGADNITASAGADNIVGGQGNDTIDGAGGIDVIIGGSGNDLVVFDANDRKIRGDSGTDTLRLSGGGDIDLTAIANNRITSFEFIDMLNDTTANVATLDFLDMLAMSKDTNTLTIDGDVLDTVNFNRLGDATTSLINGLYNEFSFSGFTLSIDTDITLNLI